MNSLRLAFEKEALRQNQFRKMLGIGSQFGILTAYLGPNSKSENKNLNTDLVVDLQTRGYRFTPLKSKWEGVRENSYLVPNMDFRDAIELGKKYGQQAVIYKDPSGVLGVYYPAEKVVEVAVKPDGDIAAELSRDPDLYSKSRGLSFSFGVLWGQKIPWSLSRPVVKADVEGWLGDGSLAF